MNAERRAQTGTHRYRCSILLGALQLISAALFALILYVLNMLFGGEFLLIAENVWIFAVFAGILVISPVYSLIKASISARKGRDWGLRLDRLDNSTPWLLGWAIWNMLVGCVLVAGYIAVLGLLGDLVGGLLVILGLVLVIPFLGYGVQLIWSSIKVFYKRIRAKQNTKLTSGMLGVGLAFAFIACSFVLVFASYNPRWAAGLSYQTLFVSGEGGRDYRIPSMLVLPGDVVLAFCESRAKGMSDGGDIDIVMRRSTDGGTTWSSTVVIAENGLHTAGNPCPVYDADNNTVHMVYNLNNREVWVINTTDGGMTWGAPRDLTTEIGLVPTGFGPIHGCGPGNGIQLSTGRLVVPCYYWNTSVGSNVIYSDDHGVTWLQGGMITVGGECQVVEAENGSLYMNMRNEGFQDNFRAIAWSNDGGQTWGAPYIDHALPDVPCQASVCRLTLNDTYAYNRMLYSGPNYHSRGHYVVRMSFDESRTWPVEKEVYSGPSAYGQLAVLANKTVCLLFEAGKYDYREGIYFTRFDVNWLSNGVDHLA